MNKEEFKTRVLDWAQKLDAEIVSIAVRPMSNKWASYSTTGRLNFNVDVLKLDDDLKDYVIVHELLHAFAPNHGRLWKSLMTAHLGDYEELELRLSKDA